MAQEWFWDFEEKRFEKDLKRISSNINKQKQKFNTEMAEIQTLIKNMHENKRV